MIRGILSRLATIPIDIVRVIDSTAFGKKAIDHIIINNNRTIVDFSFSERRIILDLINKIRNEVDMLLTSDEAYYIYMAVKQTNNIEGDIAEVGVYQGGSSKIICEAKNKKPLHLFDTFSGIPSVEDIDIAKFKKGQFSQPLDNVKKYLSSYDKVFFYKGIFPETAHPIVDKNFSFVHLDVDTYQSTLNCLKFFFPRISPGGIIISHDYLNAPGVRKAFDEFFLDKQDPIIELLTSQCLIVKH